MLDLLSKIKAFWRRDDGVAATEFALIAPLFILLAIGVFDIGRYISERLEMENIARASAEYVVLGGSVDDIATDIVDYYIGGEVGASQDYNISSDFVCTCSDGIAVDCSLVACSAGDYSRRFVNVSITRDFDAFFPYPGIAHSVSLEGHARMRTN